MRNMLIDSYFYTHIFYLLDFNIYNVILFNTKYFFLRSYLSQFFFDYKKEKKKGLPDVVIDSLLPTYLNSTHDLGSLVQ